MEIRSFWGKNSIKLFKVCNPLIIRTLEIIKDEHTLPFMFVNINSALCLKMVKAMSQRKSWIWGRKDCKNHFRRCKKHSIPSLSQNVKGTNSNLMFRFWSGPRRNYSGLCWCPTNTVDTILFLSLIIFLLQESGLSSTTCLDSVSWTPGPWSPSPRSGKPSPPGYCVLFSCPLV